MQDYIIGVIILIFQIIILKKIEKLTKRPSELQAEENEKFDGNDPILPKARELVIQSQKASTSYLQRRLSLGYARAARLMDILETEGIIGPDEGASPRKVLKKSSEQ
ncbi:MAG: hypothetical protein GX453_06530 [Lactococcus chungangensis]|uniref:FtsK gamma domain-containing protein n=1 Tax=Pseudolactococcus chungangensis TaxID=451457 RepID=A0A847J4Q6_9LACT|nr:hypothetical protein [Lactococcus chungangensis]